MGERDGGTTGGGKTDRQPRGIAKCYAEGEVEMMKIVKYHMMRQNRVRISVRGNTATAMCLVSVGENEMRSGSNEVTTAVEGSVQRVRACWRQGDKKGPCLTKGFGARAQDTILG